MQNKLLWECKYHIQLGLLNHGENISFLGVCDACL